MLPKKMVTSPAFQSRKSDPILFCATCRDNQMFQKGVNDMKRVKRFLYQLFCKHYKADLIRWHWTHGPAGNDPASVEAEYCCNNCGKTIYVHLYGKDASEWAKVMKNHKKV